MNKLPIEKREQVINLLVEGSSIRATSRITGVSAMTVMKLLVDVGNACDKFHDETVINVKAQRVQADEIWSFVYAKQKNVSEEMPDGSGDCWTWTSLDADSKLIISWFAGNRDAESANVFMQDVAARLANRVQLTTDAHRAYLDAVEGAFEDNIDYAMLVKLYGVATGENATERKYSCAECTGTIKKTISGQPKKKVCVYKLRRAPKPYDADAHA